MNLWVVFITGLTVGGLTCLAVQGGLLASTIAAREDEDTDSGSRKKHSLVPIGSFLIAKLIAYTLLGFLLGLFGQALSLSDNVQIVMQIFAGVYMVAIALNLLNLHPIFRYVVIQPPKFLTRIVRNQSKSKDLFAPALLGAMTIFIPCGTTLAMEALAISSGNPFLGAGIMAAFVLGTMPLFFGLGFLTTTLGDTFKARFYKFAGFAVLYLGITSINGGLVAGGSPITLQSIAENFPIQIDLNEPRNRRLAREGYTTTDNQRAKLPPIENGYQVASIQVSPTAYTPREITVKAGMPVKLNLTTSEKLGCTAAFRIPSLNISKRLTPASTDSVEFTPKNPGKIAFTCAMGMYTGVIEVI